MDPTELKEFIEAIGKEIRDQLAKVTKEQKDLTEKLAILEAKAAAGDDVAEIKAKAEESGKELEQLGEALIDLQKKMAARHAEGKTMGRIIAEAKGFAEVARGEQRSLEIKDITTGSFGSLTLPGGVRRGDRGLIEPVNQQLFLRDLIPTANTNAAVIEYLRETGYTNNAGYVAEGAQKPQSELTFAPQTATMVKMAHSFRVSEEMLDDVDGMEAYINQRGLYGLMLKEEDALLNGPGTAGTIDGLIANSTAYAPTTVPGVTPANAMDDIRVGIAQVAEADLVATGVVMNHLDAAALDLEKDADGNYLHPAFRGNLAWGLPVVRTKGIAAGRFMVGGFVGNTMIWQRKGIEIRRSTEDRDNFIKNLVTILLEERLQLETLRPEGVIEGPLTVPGP